MSRPRIAGRDQAPFEDDYRGFELDEDESARGPLILVLALGVLVIFGGVVWNTYRQGVRPDGAVLPTVLAESPDFKRVPDDPGGEIVPHVDKRFYDDMDGRERPVTAEPAVARIAVPASPESLSGGPPTDLRPAPPPETAQQQAPDDAPGNGALAETVTDIVEPAPRPLPAPEPIVPLVTAPEFAFAPEGDFFVQLAAFRSDEAAEAAWKRLSESSPELFRDAGKHIQRADLGANGVFYRLRVGRFADKSEAGSFCEALKKNGANCIVVTG